MRNNPSSSLYAGDHNTQTALKKELDENANFILSYLKADDIKKKERDENLMFSPKNILRKFKSANPTSHSRLVELVKGLVNNDKVINEKGEVEKVKSDFMTIVNELEKELNPNDVMRRVRTTPPTTPTRTPTTTPTRTPTTTPTATPVKKVLINITP